MIIQMKFQEINKNNSDLEGENFQELIFLILTSDKTTAKQTSE